jgi:hypothetical protein
MARSRISWDNNVERRDKIKVDSRVGPTLDVIDWDSKVVIDPETQMAYVPLEEVESIMIENEELRETLYTQYIEPEERAHETITRMVGNSTSGILNKIRHIESWSNNAITGKDIFGFIYTIIVNEYHIDLNSCPPNKSKLQYIWSIGALPIVSFQVELLYHLVQYQRKMAPQEFNSWCAALRKHLNKPKKISNRAPF